MVTSLWYPNSENNKKLAELSVEHCWIWINLCWMCDTLNMRALATNTAKNRTRGRKIYNEHVLTRRRSLLAQAHGRQCRPHEAQRIDHRHDQRQLGGSQHDHIQHAARLVQAERHQVLPACDQKVELPNETFNRCGRFDPLDADGSASDQRIGGAPQEADQYECGCARATREAEAEWRFSSRITWDMHSPLPQNMMGF